MPSNSSAPLESFARFTKLVTEDRDLCWALEPVLPRFVPHRPTEAQAAFLLLDCREALYGGAAGGGKSEALLMAALQYVDRPGYAALLLRRTYTDLALPGALMDRARDWLTGAARFDDLSKTWTFPSGASLSFGYLDSLRHKYRYQSSEFQFIGFDELTQFEEAEYLYLLSRLRRPAGSQLPLRMRSASNPGGVGHEWVRRRFLIEGPPRDRYFLPARLADNPHLDADHYSSTLAELDPVTKAQLLDGDWEVSGDSLLPLDTIHACQCECLWEGGMRIADCGLGRVSKIPQSPIRNPHLYMGVDVGRTRDLTVLWTWQRQGDVFWCREILCLKNISFRDQKKEIDRRLRSARTGSSDALVFPARVLKCAIDKGGIGMQLAEELEAEYPGVVEGVQLTGQVQGRLAHRMAILFAEERVRIPGDPELLRDLRLVRRPRVVGGTSWVSTRRDSTGHADRFWAAALALDAALSIEIPPLLTAASLPRTFVPSAARSALPLRRGLVPHQA